MLKEEEKFTTKTLVGVIILSAAFTFFWDAFTVFLPQIAFCTQNVSTIISTPGVCLLGSPFLTLLVVMGLIRIPSMRKYLTKANLVYLYVTALSAAYFANVNYPWMCVVGITFTKLFTSELQAQYIPDFVGLSKDLAYVIWNGTGSVGAIPWVALFPNILWNFLIVALFGCMSISIASIFRRQVVDVEMIPFPHVMLAHTALVNVESSVKPAWASKRPFLMGILAGFLCVMPVSGVTLFPWFPDILAWRTNTCGPGSQYIAPADYPWHLGILKNPTMYAMSLLVPLNFLFSTVFYTLILELALFISYYGLGAYTGMTQLGFCGRNWCTPAPYHDPPLYFAVINTGCILGFFVITLFLQRGYLAGTLRDAFGGSSGRKATEGEPMSYRNAWALLVTSYALMIAFFMYTGLTPWLSFVVTLSGVISWFVAVNIWGRAGIYWDSPCYNVTPGFVRLLVWPTLQQPEVTSTDLAVGPVITTTWAGHQSIAGWGGSMFTAFGSYRMAHLTGVSSKNVLKVMAAALFVSMFVSKIAQVALLGVVGASTIPTNIVNQEPIPGDRWNNFWSKPTAYPMAEVIPWVVVGFVFMVVMRFLSSRILWLPDPLAAIPAWSWTVSLHGVWFPFLVAWVVKSIILRTGGSKLYEQWVVPFVGGFILGNTLEILLAATTGYVISYYMP